MRRTQLLERLVEVGLAFGGVVYIVIMLEYPSRAGVVPAIVGVVMLSALGVQIVQGLRERRAQPLGESSADAATKDAEDDEPEGLLGDLTPEQMRRLFAVVLWSIALFGLIQFLGFVLGPAVGIVALLLGRREPVVLSLALGIGVAAGLYLLLTYVVLLPWDRAPVFELLGFS